MCPSHKIIRERATFRHRENLGLVEDRPVDVAPARVQPDTAGLEQGVLAQLPMAGGELSIVPADRPFFPSC
jgi:hypothetical protein